MFRQSHRFLSRARAAVIRCRRQLSTDMLEETKADSPFVEAWKKNNTKLGATQDSFSLYERRPSPPSSIPSKLTVNFVLPYSSQLSNNELKPGVLSVHEGSEVTKYFVSSGFALIHANSFADIVAVEAVPLDRIDPIQVQKGLSEFT
ncbi:hypothetical protein Vadar_016672 [Vaccinium darrowii]|uniref:Uncharacterized protein n=1 Tax=Vaccinium darrowii TaxID=229202 RepID=A0ACB7YMN6_9ERIC|nr:hypothetical protein Vadar_016672 [Vaccinium darrowii]